MKKGNKLSFSLALVKILGMGIFGTGCYAIYSVYSLPIMILGFSLMMVGSCIALNECFSREYRNNSRGNLTAQKNSS